jgi:hypothetical protein
VCDGSSYQLDWLERLVEQTSGWVCEGLSKDSQTDYKGSDQINGLSIVGSKYE